MPLKPAFASTLALAACAVLAAPAAAQNTAEPAVITAPPPKSDTPPSTTTPPATSTPPVTVTEPAPAPVVVVPQTAPSAPPMEPVTIDPDAAYPNGFGDPLDPNATNVALDYQQRGGFDWGLLGLLGLLGLIPLFRDRGGQRVVYVERDDAAPRRVIREERIDRE